MYPTSQWMEQEGEPSSKVDARMKQSSYVCACKTVLSALGCTNCPANISRILTAAQSKWSPCSVALGTREVWVENANQVLYSAQVVLIRNISNP